MAKALAIDTFYTFQMCRSDIELVSDELPTETI